MNNEAGMFVPAFYVSRLFVKISLGEKSMFDRMFKSCKRIIDYIFFKKSIAN